MPTLEAKDYLRLLEESNRIAFVDIEATGLRGDYNSTLVVSIKPYNGAVSSFHVAQPGNDQKLVRVVKDALEQFDCWVTYYGKGFDIPFLNTRLLRWKRPPIEKRHHIDLYFTLKYNLLTARKSQAHLLRFLDTPEQKMDMSPEEWNKVLADPEKFMPKMIKRCESDVEGLQGLYEKTKHLVRDVKK
jgi:uncharacterized protein YprB with RNaseH-like and TPR domain